MNGRNELKNKRKFFGNHPFFSCYSIFALIMIFALLMFLLTNFNLFNITSISIGSGVIVLFGLIIFLVENKIYEKDLSRSTTQYISGKIVITESVKGLRFALIPILVVFLSIMIFASVGMLITIGGLNMILAVIIMWIIIGVLLIPIFIKLLRGTSKLRKFIISDNFIQILVPPRPLFQVNWSDFNKIELKIIPYMKIPAKYEKKEIKIHELSFIGNEFHQSFEVFYGRDFYRKFYEIIDILKKKAIEKNKGFLGIEEK